MHKLSRRQFVRESLGSVLAFSLVSSLSNAQSLKGSVGSMASKWVFEMEHVTASMRAGTITQLAWQSQIDDLLHRVDHKDLLKAIDYDRLAKAAIFPEDHESAENVDFSGITGPAC